MISLKSAEERNPSTQEVYREIHPYKLKGRTHFNKLLHIESLRNVQNSRPYK